MPSPPEFVEIEKGFFIERRQYLNLISIGFLPWEIGPYLRREAKLKALISKVGKPLEFQEKIKEEL